MVKKSAPENKAAKAAPENKEAEAVEAPSAQVFDESKRIKVTMLGSALGCDVGVIHGTMYKQGEQYEIGASLYNSFKSKGLVD